MVVELQNLLELPGGVVGSSYVAEDLLVGSLYVCPTEVGVVGTTCHNGKARVCGIGRGENIPSVFLFCHVGINVVFCLPYISIYILYT